MGARWMEAKKLKQRKMRRAWARPLSIKSGIQPNREIIRQYQDTAKGLGQPIARAIYANVAPGKYDINDRIEEILSQFDDPLFVTIIENNYQRIRLFFNSEKTCWIIQHVNWRTREVRISITYRSKDRALQVWVQSKVVWKHKKSLPAPAEA